MTTRRFSLASLALPAILLIAAGCAPSSHTLQNNDRIIFLGDSITEQGVQPKGYVTLVRDSLARRLPGVEVVGAGISGNKVTDLQNRLDRDVVSKNPTVVVIYIGINDVWHWDLKNHRGTTQEQFELGLRDIIGRIRSVNARVVLCTPTVIGEKHAGQNSQDALLDEYAGISRRVAREEGVTLCDLRAWFVGYLEGYNSHNADKGILTTDGVHLNESGNRFVAQKMVEILSHPF